MEGKIINQDKDKIQEFNFEKINYDLSKYISNSTKYPKIQEYDSIFIIKCVYFILFNKLKDIQDKTLGSSYAQLHKSKCERKNFNVVLEEVLKRLYKPLYLPLLGLVSCILILKSKDEINYGRIKILLFIFSFILLVISEISLRYSATNSIGSMFFLLFPILTFIFIYFAINRKLTL